MGKEKITPEAAGNLFPIGRTGKADELTAAVLFLCSVVTRLFLLQVVQLGLAGLMDGSVSALAPLFAAAFATQQNWPTFLVGLASAIGAGISMGGPWLRGAVCGLMTALGGLGHALPYLVPDTIPDHFRIATTIAGVVVFFELWAIAFVRARYMDTPFLQAVFQIVLGGAIVLGAGVLIGGA
jgi:hypothetical protein